ncbi:MAG: isocitrate lyase/phosphoenolpyruvate mutase family protein, partial [Acidobacteria bacterium]|nr:isocitrate lyase/phosphoenolpyruvate mutase family protein [Acidobacteriota bacterium]
MADVADELRALHRTPPIFVLPNAWDAASARLLVAEGFGGTVPAREMFEAVARIARSVKVPVTADIEHAYAASPDAVADNVLRVIASGAVGINLEDYVPGATDLEPLGLQVDKIKALVKASTKAGVRLVINARTDGFLRALGPADGRL